MITVCGRIFWMIWGPFPNLPPINQLDNTPNINNGNRNSTLNQLLSISATTPNNRTARTAAGPRTINPNSQLQEIIRLGF
jgi:hypothetical protein